MKLIINLTEITSLSYSNRIKYPCPFCGKLFLQTVADRRNHVSRIHHLDLPDEKIEELVHDPTMQNIKDMARKMGVKDIQLQQNVREYMKI